MKSLTTSPTAGELRYPQPLIGRKSRGLLVTVISCEWRDAGPIRALRPLNTRQWQSVYSIQLTLVMQDVTLNTIRRGVLEAVSGQAHNLEVGGSIPPVATKF